MAKKKKRKAAKRTAKKRRVTRKTTRKKAKKRVTRRKATRKKARKKVTKRRVVKKKKKKAKKKKVAKKKKKVAKKKKAKRKSSRKPNPAFMKALKPDAALAAVVGSKPLPRTEVVKSLWKYIKKHGLQDSKNRRNINADAKLKAVFNGKRTVSMFEMSKLISKHLK